MNMQNISATIAFTDSEICQHFYNTQKIVSNSVLKKWVCHMKTNAE